MKKTLCLILALLVAVTCALSLASCTQDPPSPTPDPDRGPIVKDIYQIISESKPTKTVSEVSYTTSRGVKLDALYTLEISGGNSIFKYEYKRFSDPAVEGQLGADPIIPVNGAVYFKDGKYSTDGINYTEDIPASHPLTFNIEENKLVDPILSPDGKTLIAIVTPADAALMFGSDLNATGEIVLEVVTEGVNVRLVKLSYTTRTGAEVVINTSYSYGAVTLNFPSQD